MFLSQKHIATFKMDYPLYIPSNRICQEKLREIQRLKEKQLTEPLTTEELVKIGRETYYTRMSQTKDPKVLEIIPDDIQQIIFEFLDPNTRVRMLRYKYNIKSVKHSLDETYGVLISSDEVRSNLRHRIFGFNRCSTIRRCRSVFNYLYRIIKRVSPIMNAVLDHNGEIYKSIFIHSPDSHASLAYYFLDHSTNYSKRNCKGYIQKFIKTIEVTFKHYTKMYTMTPALPTDVLRQYEFMMISLYGRLFLDA